MNTQELLVKMVLQAWELQVKRTGTVFNSLSDEQLLQEIAPGKNRGIYLLGHMVAVNDALFSLLGLGERLHPELEEAFITHPDTCGVKMPAIHALRQYWVEVHEGLAVSFARLSPEQWLQRHNAMTDEDLEKEPHRNKLSVLINRTSHIAYHLGQLVLIRRSDSRA